MADYLVATIKPWNISAFHRRTPQLPGRWHLVDSAEDLDLDLIERLNPRYTFFPHWSRRVPGEILRATECVCFHMTDVPYGRGGSPLQNLIVRGHQSTRVTALRMVEEVDAGPVYLKRPLELSGTAQTIFERVAELIYDMAEEIVVKEPTPLPQQGDAVTFKRRTPEQSRLPAEASLRQVYDHIRMLDAETYPSAFAEHGDLLFRFSEAELAEDGVVARVHIATPGKGNRRTSSIWRKRS